jgi:hypothetical protein
MTPLFLILLFLVFCFSLYRTWYSSLTIKRKTFALVIRIILAGCLMLAYFQPSYTFITLSDREKTVLVVVDVSQSMALFDVDSLINRKISSAVARGIQNDLHPPALLFYGFGDSLRRLSANDPVSFSDRRSFFPDLAHTTAFKAIRNIIIISDGNWTNANFQSSPSPEKEIRYVPLSVIKRHPYCRIEAPSSLRVTSADSSIPLSLRVSGYNPRPVALDITVRNRQRLLWQRTIPADSGTFTNAIVISLPRQAPGTYLFRVNAAIRGERSPVATGDILCRVSAASFTVAFHSSAPSMDKRFLSLAFDRRREWQRVNRLHSSFAPDVLAIMSWDAVARDMIKMYPKAVVAFFGTLPAQSLQTVTLSAFRPIPAPEYSSALSRITRLPPPENYIRSSELPYTINRTLVSIDTSTSAYPGNYPLLYDAFFQKHLIFVAAVGGIWRWDFWSQASDEAQDSLYMSDLIINHLQDLVEYNKNQTLFAYPALSPIYESDSIRFKIAIPQSFTVRPNRKCLFTITDTANHTIYNVPIDTLQTADNPLITLPGLEKGMYIYRCAMSGDTGVMYYTDTLTIMANNEEYRVMRQNTLLLNEGATPAAFFDSTASSINSFESIIDGPDTVRQRFHISRSRLLLALIFGLFAVEWALRKWWKLD